MLPLGIVQQQGGGAPYITTGKVINYPGGNYYSRAGAYFSWNATSYTECFFARIPYGTTSDKYLLSVGGRHDIRTQATWDNGASNNDLRFAWLTSSGVARWAVNNLPKSTHGISADTWFPILYSYQQNNAEACYINDVGPITPSTVGSIAALIGTNTSASPCKVGANYTGSGGAVFAISQFMAHAGYLDITVEANRRKFYGTDKRPIDWGDDGSLPLGVQPYYFFPDGDFTNNRGSQTTWTWIETGTVPNSSTSPTD